MKTLKEALGSGAERPGMIAETLRMIDAEVKDKGGFSGLAIRGAYKVVKTIKPGFLRAVVDGLLDGFLESLEPIWKEASGPGDFRTRLTRARSRAAEALLGVTDSKARNAKTKTVKKLYDKLRPSAKGHVEAAIPRLSALLERNLQRLKNLSS